jgi:hypothetical protein
MNFFNILQLLTLKLKNKQCQILNLCEVFIIDCVENCINSYVGKYSKKLNLPMLFCLLINL